MAMAVLKDQQLLLVNVTNGASIADRHRPGPDPGRRRGPGRQPVADDRRQPRPDPARRRRCADRAHSMAICSTTLVGGQVEAEDLAEEAELAVEGGADVGRLTEAVLLAGERPVGDGHALGPEGGDDLLRLARRHDLVLQALEDDQRTVDEVDVEERRPRLVHVARLRPRADQAVEVAGLELVRVAGEGGEVGDPVVVGAGAEDVLEGHRGEDREPAGGAAADAEPSRDRCRPARRGTGRPPRSPRRRRCPTGRAAARGTHVRSPSTRGG